MLLTFTLCESAILRGRKTTTIRQPTAPRMKQLINMMVDHEINFHLWWQNPRNRGPECYKMAVAPYKSHRVVKGKDFTLKDAERDGFHTRDGLMKALMNLYELDWDEVMAMNWVILEWDPSTIVWLPEARARRAHFAHRREEGMS